MHALYTVTVFIHILAACVWIGAMVFFAAVVVPVVRRPEYSSVFTELVRRVGSRFRALGWTCIAVLVATGVFNLTFRGVGPEIVTNAAFWRTDFGRALGFKLTFVLLTVLATAAHDFLSAPSARRSRRVASWLGRATLLFSVAAVLCAVWLVRGMP
jgi:copper resistance protein D